MDAGCGFVAEVLGKVPLLRSSSKSAKIAVGINDFSIVSLPAAAEVQFAFIGFLRFMIP